jgi:hypothetical protein
MEMVSKVQIMFDSKAQADLKAERTRYYLGILNWIAIPL